jgi:hypothetical protein
VRALVKLISHGSTEINIAALTNAAAELKKTLEIFPEISHVERDITTRCAFISRVAQAHTGTPATRETPHLPCNVLLILF